VATVKIILEHFHHAYAQTDGTMKWPNSREGDILRGSFEILCKYSVKYDDVLAAADAYSDAYHYDSDVKKKLHFALENAITNYAQAWANEQNKEILDKVRLIKEISVNSGLYDSPMSSIRDYAVWALTNSDVDELKGRLDAEVAVREFVCKANQYQRDAKREKARADKLERENRELKAQCEARNKEQNSLEEQRDHNAECCKFRDDKINAIKSVLDAARVDNGGTNKTLVDYFKELHDLVK
jgi:hypothetical protein